MKFTSGSLLILSSLFVVFALWILFQFNPTYFPEYFLDQLNQITALIGTTLLAWSMILTTRLNILEKLFDGMNEVYKVHRKTSLYGMVFIIIHVCSLTIQRLPNTNEVLKFLLPLHNQIFINIGAISLWLFIAIVGLTLVVKRIGLPYHIWKYTHKFIGIALILALIHISLTPGLYQFTILNTWIIFFTGIGVASWIYFEFFYTRVAPLYSYRVSEIEKDRDVYKVKLTPIKKKMNYKPGQYAYLSFSNENVGTEIHPYTMTSHPSEKELSFAIKILGDYTSGLGLLKVGDNVKIWGPYGNFGDKYLNSGRDAVFIGGGIGIAPFISMLKEGAAATGKQTSVFYCTKYQNEACFNEEIKRHRGNNPGMFYLNQCSREKGHITVPEILDRIRNIKDTLLFICGPKRMIKPLVAELTLEGIPKENIITEDFDLL